MATSTKQLNNAYIHIYREYSANDGGAELRKRIIQGLPYYVIRLNTITRTIKLTTPKITNKYR